MDLPKLNPGKRYTLPRPTGSADALLLAVPHDQLVSMSAPTLLAKVKPAGYVIDVKSRLDASAVIATGRKVWRL